MLSQNTGTLLGALLFLSGIGIVIFGDMPSPHAEETLGWSLLGLLAAAGFWWWENRRGKG